MGILSREGLCVWLTGLPCAGKSTLAVHLAGQLRSRGLEVVVFDGDEVRKDLSRGLGFSREDRHANVLRVASAARDVVEKCGVAICALVSPYAQAREEARQAVGAQRFIEVYVNTPIEICEARDLKGLYAAARSGKMEHFTGVNDPYEAPRQPEVIVTGVGVVEEALGPILKEFDRRGAWFQPLDASTAERFANLALECIHREYPNKMGHHVLNSDRDAKPPREVTPAFYGCYDWHSAVHGHWMLARLARLFPDAAFAARAKQGLARNLTAENLQREAEYVGEQWRTSFERPYGLAWLLRLAAELAEWNDAGAREWSLAMRPLVDVVVVRLETWLGELPHPVRSGEHSQSAFSLALMLDYAKACERRTFTELIEGKVRDFYLADRNGPLDYEPSGEDFLSPCLAEADVVRRVIGGREFSGWLTQFLPSIPRDGTAWIAPAQVTDRGDPKLGHLDGLNLSRAWMLYGIARALPEDARLASLRRTAGEHARVGLAAVTGENYEGAHWLGTFAVYLHTTVFA